MGGPACLYQVYGIGDDGLGCDVYNIEDEDFEDEAGKLGILFQRDRSDGAVIGVRAGVWGRSFCKSGEHTPVSEDERKKVDAFIAKHFPDRRAGYYTVALDE